MNKAIAGLSILILSCGMTVGCAPGTSGAPKQGQVQALSGRHCTVVYRRDALGLSLLALKPDERFRITPDVIESSDVGTMYTHGWLKETSDQWILLQTDDELRLIPVTSVLQIRFSGSEKK